MKTILVIDWPSKEVPESLARAGMQVFVRGGTGPSDYSVYELRGGAVVARHVGHRPERASVIYAFRPLSELPQIISAAKELDARTIWTQSGWSSTGEKDPRGCWVPEEELRAARTLVESAGLRYVTEPYIVSVASELAAS